MARVLVACMGCGLSGDRAAGAAVHGLLRGVTLPESARLALVPSGTFQLLRALDGEEVLVVVGEVERGAPVGTVHVLDWREVPLGSDAGAKSGHALRVTMEAARIQDPARAPRRAFLVGIEGRTSGTGADCMHPQVAGALAGAARLAIDLARGLAELREDEATPAPRATPTPPRTRAAER